MRKSDQPDRNVDRRRARRQALARDAYFGAGDIEVLPQAGQALDVSRDGILIRTARPLPEGTPIEVEMRPEKWNPGKHLILTRGRVARIVDRGDGDYDMGVHLHVTPGPDTPVASTREAAFAINDLGSLMRNLRPRTAVHAHPQRPGWAGPYSKGVRIREARAAARPRTAWQAWRWPLLILLLGLLALLLWPWLLSDLRPVGGLQRYPADPSPDPGIEETPLVREVPVAPRGGDTSGTESVEPLQDTSPPVTELSWPEPDRSMLRHADYPPVPDEASTGQATYSTRGQSADEQAGRTPYSFHGRSENPARSAAYAAATEGALLDVDRGAHRMRLYINGTLHAEFPIGLGQDGSTPAGEFTIGNKLTDSDWYNRGNVVPAGDPENSLGRRWLRLARKGALTPYGIHSTNDLNSVGKNNSRG